jgi:hypothetical protein
VGTKLGTVKTQTSGQAKPSGYLLNLREKNGRGEWI